eukprot:5491321-Prymnesium_polylepis.1
MAPKRLTTMPCLSTAVRKLIKMCSEKSVVYAGHQRNKPKPPLVPFNCGAEKGRCMKALGLTSAMPAETLPLPPLHSRLVRTTQGRKTRCKRTNPTKCAKEREDAEQVVSELSCPESKKLCDLPRSCPE